MLYVKGFGRMREFYTKMLQAQPINAEWTDSWAFFNVGARGSLYMRFRRGLPRKLTFRAGCQSANRVR